MPLYFHGPPTGAGHVSPNDLPGALQYAWPLWSWGRRQYGAKPEPLSCPLAL